jgi:hypothetical protein
MRRVAQVLVMLSPPLARQTQDMRLRRREPLPLFLIDVVEKEGNRRQQRYQHDEDQPAAQTRQTPKSGPRASGVAAHRIGRR